MKWLKPEEVEPGMDGVDSGGNTVTIDYICQVEEITEKKWNVFKSYDENGTLPSFEEMWDFFGEEKMSLSDYLICASMEGEHSTTKGVLRYARWNNDANAVLVPISELYKKSEKLKETNKKTGIFEKYIENDEWLQAEQIVPGMIGEDYGNERIVVKHIFCFETLTDQQYEIMRRFDEFGNLPSTLSKFKDEEYRFENEMTDDDYYVCCVREGFGKAVLPYGGHGVLVPSTEAWKISKTLKTANDKLGVLEHLKSFKNFK